MRYLPPAAGGRTAARMLAVAVGMRDDGSLVGADTELLSLRGEGDVAGDLLDLGAGGAPRRLLSCDLAESFAPDEVAVLLPVAVLELPSRGLRIEVSGPPCGHLLPPSVTDAKVDHETDGDQHESDHHDGKLREREGPVPDQERPDHDDHSTESEGRYRRPRDRTAPGSGETSREASTRSCR